jgi:pentatricopeptide repeat protein
LLAPSIISGALSSRFTLWKVTGKRAIKKEFLFYNQMVKDRIKPDVITFNILISGYCRNFKYAFALEMFEEMCKMGCHPNVVTFNTLIRGLFRECRSD